MKSDSIIHLADTFTKSIKWIEEVTNERVKGRLLDTEEIAHEAKRAYIESAEIDKDGVLYTELKEDFFNTVGDIRWLVDTYVGLHKCPISNNLKNQLKKIQGGPLYPKDENINSSSGEPRNIHFELIISSILATSGIGRLLNTGTSDGVHDLFGVPLFCECKRIQTIKGIPRCIKKAKRQLRRGFLGSNHINPVGIIAVDASKSSHFMGGEKILVSQNEESARSFLGNKGVDLLKKTLAEKLYPNILGTFIYSITPIAINKQLTIGSFLTFGINRDLDPKLKPLLAKFQYACKIREY